METSTKEIRTAATKKIKPLLRGVSHQAAAFIAFIAGAALVFAAPSARAAWGAAIYGLSLVALFGISATYHRPTWNPQQRQFMRKLDHSAIFVLIAGTYTPLTLLVFPANRGDFLLALVWGGAVLGIVQSIFWPSAPKALVALLCVALGWVRAGMTTLQLALIAVGGIVYTIGAIIYAVRRPDPWPTIFGYHEIFHALIIAATICHSTAIAQVVLASA